ncbi:MAG: sporulation protein YqfD [Clostridia bacterium]|nr:sporulation protein YqfD [Clostridia bacterium]MBQ6882894.1 sporulation protein YqfD [Clostridia bacterium]
MSTVDILFEGLNLNLLIERLKKHGVNIYHVNKLDQKHTVIRIKYKDLSKAFAISQNMWYNTILGYGGIIGLYKKLKKALLPIVLGAVFMVAAFFSDRLVLDIKITNSNKAQTAQILKVLDGAGIKKYKIVNVKDLKSVQESLYTGFNQISFVTIKKSGNRLIISPIYKKSPQSVDKNKSIIAQKSGKIIKLVVVSGTPLIKVGDTVSMGDVLVDGAVALADGTIIQQDAIASYQMVCTAYSEITCDNGTLKESLIAKAIFDLGVEEDAVLSATITPAIKSKNTTTYRVSVTYLHFKEF